MKQNKILALVLVFLCVMAVSACTRSNAMTGGSSWPLMTTSSTPPTVPMSRQSITVKNFGDTRKMIKAVYHSTRLRPLMGPMSLSEPMIISSIFSTKKTELLPLPQQSEITKIRSSPHRSSLTGKFTLPPAAVWSAPIPSMSPVRH